MDFWKRCAEAGCVIVPVVAYEKYNELGNTNESDQLGLRFMALSIYNEVVGPDYYLGVEAYEAGVEPFKTPEEALAAFEESKK